MDRLVVVVNVFSPRSWYRHLHMYQHLVYTEFCHIIDTHHTVFRHTCTFSATDTTDLVLLPNRGHILGGTSVIVAGPCFDESLEYTCRFGTGRFVSIEFVEYTWMRGGFSVCPPWWHKVEMLGLGCKYEEKERQESFHRILFHFIHVHNSA